MVRRLQRGFTMIELLTVMAISAILLGIIAIPMVQGFNLTRAAQAYADAQNRVRILMAQIERDINQGAGVRNMTTYRSSIDIIVPGLDGNPETVRLDRAKIDIMLPAQGEPGAIPGQFNNPDTGRIDPTLKSPRGQILLPVAAGPTIVRYFVGLRDPFIPYRNPYDGLLMAKSAVQDNLFVLYRAEVPKSASFFTLDANGDWLIDDPAFFTLLPGTELLPDGSLTAAGRAKADRIHQWSCPCMTRLREG